MQFVKNLVKCKKGAAMVEYALLIGGVALIGAASIAVFGHKVNDMIGLTAAVLPGAHTDDNAPVVSGKIIETSDQVNGEDPAGGGGTVTGIGLDIPGIVAGAGSSRLGNNLGLDVTNLVLESP